MKTDYKKYGRKSCRGCVYALEISGVMRCGYMYYTGHSRSCDPAHCTRKDTDPAHKPEEKPFEIYQPTEI